MTCSNLILTLLRKMFWNGIVILSLVFYIIKSSFKLNSHLLLIYFRFGLLESVEVDIKVTSLLMTLQLYRTEAAAGSAPHQLYQGAPISNLD